MTRLRPGKRMKDVVRFQSVDMMQARLWSAVALVLGMMLLLPSLLSASGWNDYELQIDDDYWIWKSNSLQVHLTSRNVGVFIDDITYKQIGPITHYAVTPGHIVVKTAGRKNRNLFEGDTFVDIDYSQEFLFIVDKSARRVHGPFDRPTFDAEVRSQGVAAFSWNEPRNPNILLPLFGAAVFLGIIGAPFLFLLLLALLLSWVVSRTRS